MKIIANFNRTTTWTVGLTMEDGTPVSLDVALSHVSAILAEQGFDGFTATPAIGYWKGRADRFVVVTLCSDDDEGMTLDRAKRVAAQIADRLFQECVLVSHISRDTPMAYLVEG